MTDITNEKLQQDIREMFCQSPPAKPLTAGEITEALANYYGWENYSEDFALIVKEALQMEGVKPRYLEKKGVAYVFSKVKLPKARQKRMPLVKTALRSKVR